MSVFLLILLTCCLAVAVPYWTVILVLIFVSRVNMGKVDQHENNDEDNF